MDIQGAIRYGGMLVAMAFVYNCDAGFSHTTSYTPEKQPVSEQPVTDRHKHGSDATDKLEVSDVIEETTVEEDWSFNYFRKQGGKLLFATTVVAGAAAVAAVTGGAALSVIACTVTSSPAIGPVGLAGAKVGGVLGGLYGGGYGAGLAIQEFDAKEHSPTAKRASTVGKIVLTTAAASPLVGVPVGVTAVEEGVTLFGYEAATFIAPAARLSAVAAGLATAEASK